MMNDRRKYVRIGSGEMISFAYLEDGHRLAVTQDLSVGGIRFETVGCDINLGETLRVTFNVEDETIVAVGRVIWATETDPITTEVGLEFIEIDLRAVRLLEQLTSAPLEGAA